jgi:hypothetical protein
MVRGAGFALYTILPAIMNEHASIPRQIRHDSGIDVLLWPWQPD